MPSFRPLEVKCPGQTGRSSMLTEGDLRRSGATMMAELGVLSEIIERCLNHVEMNRMKRTYQRHEYRSEQKTAWQLLGNRLEALLNLNETMTPQESSVPG